MYRFSHEVIAGFAYHLWELRGRPIGSPDIDWHRAEAELEARHRALDRLGFGGIAYEADEGEAPRTQMTT